MGVAAGEFPIWMPPCTPRTHHTPCTSALLALPDFKTAWGILSHLELKCRGVQWAYIERCLAEDRTYVVKLIAASAAISTVRAPILKPVLESVRNTVIVGKLKVRVL